MDETKAFSLNKRDLQKILKGLAIAMGGAGITYLLGILEVLQVDWITPVYVAVAASFLNALQVWITGKNK